MNVPAEKTSPSLVLLLALAAIVLGVAACGGDDDEVAAAGEATEQTTETETTTGEQDPVVDQPVTFDLEEVEGSGVTGTAEFVPESEDSTQVTVRIEGSEGGPHPAHIHRGTCDNLDPKPYKPLEPVTGGESQTTIEKPMIEFLDGEFAVNVHESAEKIDTYIACGNLPDKGEVEIETE